MYVYQIYYDEATLRSLDPGFLPLDNRVNKRPDWYEFWVIRNFLIENSPLGDGWYGFLSPNFYLKTGFKAEDVADFVSLAETHDCDVALIPCAWDQIAYFKNPFDQGERWHPGIMDLSQKLLSLIFPNVALSDLVTHTGNFTFSNYIIAQRNYWMEWLDVANRVFEVVENNEGQLSLDLSKLTSYGSIERQAPIKAFSRTASCRNFIWQKILHRQHQCKQRRRRF